VLPYYAGGSDVYLSTQRFWCCGRIARLAECGALTADVDFYKVAALCDSHPLGVLQDCMVALERARMPQPTIAIASGRGLTLAATISFACFSVTLALPRFEPEHA